jgi:glycosyltransferase involved in cell wall biosynthesis
MWGDAKVAVVIPAYEEQRLVGATISSVPELVDAIYVVDDASTDDTTLVARASGDPRVHCLRHDRNRGVGASIVTGTQEAVAAGADVVVVMAGDNQMDPADLPRLVAAVVDGGAAYAKGNRFAHVSIGDMPALRRLGSAVLSAATRLATGLSVDDTQCGYTALAAPAAKQLPLERLWPRYGYPNDLLGMLASRGQRVVDVPVRAVYATETSGLRPWHALQIVGIIARRWWIERGSCVLPKRLTRQLSSARVAGYGSDGR